MLIYNWEENVLIESFMDYGGNFIKFLSDGRVASQWDVARVNIWNLTTGQFDLSIGIDFSVLEELNNGYLATSGDEKNIYIWSLIDGTLIETIKTNKTHTGLKQTSIDNYFASCDDSGTLYMWNSNGYSNVWIKKGIANERLLMVSMSNGTLLTGSLDAYVQFWNILTGDCLSTSLPFPGDKIVSIILVSSNILALSPTAEYIIFYEIDENYELSIINNILTTTGDNKIVSSAEVVDMKLVKNFNLLVAYETRITLYSLTTLLEEYDLPLSSDEIITSMGIFGNVTDLFKNFY